MTRFKQILGSPESVERIDKPHFGAPPTRWTFYETSLASKSAASLLFMVREMWAQFPKLLEQNINGLLDNGFPNPTKAFQLYKSCKNEELWTDNFQAFSLALEAYFAKPRRLRKKADLDQVLERPIDSETYKAFHLTFRTATIAEDSVINIASWAHNLMRVSLKTSSSTISLETLTQTLQALTNPAPFEKEINLEFDDFCESWRKTVTKKHGQALITELNGILRELRTLKTLLETEDTTPVSSPLPSIYLTQTELDWIQAVRRAADLGLQAPKFPLSRGTTKPLLMSLERVIHLYEIVRITKLPELLKHRESTRLTILARCEELVPTMKAVG